MIVVVAVTPGDAATVDVGSVVDIICVMGVVVLVVGIADGHIK